MAEVDIEYKDFEFEAHPVRVTWIQQFFLKILKEEASLTSWQKEIEEEWFYNAQIDAFKYFFDEENLDEEIKLQWAREFVDAAIEKFDSMDVKQFSDYLGEDEIWEGNYGPLRIILLNLKESLQQPFSN